MKAVLLALALLGSYALAVQGGPARSLLQAPTSAPEDCPTVFDIAQANGLTTLVEAMSADELEPYLDNNTVYPLTYTVLAPTNEALEQALAEQNTDLDSLRNSGQLDKILQYHFIITPYTEDQLVERGTVGTNYRNQTLQFADGGLVTGFASNATIVTPNVQACESVVHVIDSVLIPDFNAVAPSGESAASS